MVLQVRIIQRAQTDKYSVEDDQPVLLKGVVLDWPALRLWTPEYFENKFGDRSVTLSNYARDPQQKYKDKAKVKFSHYLNVLSGAEAESDAVNLNSYVAGWHFLKNASELMEDIRIPEPFKDNLLERVDREIINYDYISLFVGHSRVETPLHTDSFAVCVWLANVVGRKIIRVVPPIDFKNVRNGLDVFDEANVLRLNQLGIPVLEAVIEAGDVFVIPPGYWHQVRNVGFTVAVSTNHLSPFHFLTFEQQLKAKILAPYLKILKLKRELLGVGNLHHSADCLRHFNFVENETLFLDHLIAQLGEERQVVERVKELLVANLQSRLG